ncbi:MAG: hypothetical protein PHW34_07260 [Hespellia sp.]|nr:hypothetical protein [Hespellia sp.]
MGNYEKWKTLMDAFSGQKPVENMPSFPEVPIVQMVQTLCSIEEQVWGMYAFEREPLEGKISLGQKKQYIKAANECGRSWAKKVMKEYETAQPETIAKKMGIAVKKTARPIGGEIVLFAQFVRPNEITIFTDCIHKANLLEKECDCKILQEDILEKILLSHELFHAVEEKHQKEIYTHTEKIELWKKPFSNRSKIVCLSEIAAMAFAAEIMRLQVSPYMLDILLTYSYDKNAAYGLYEEICSLQAQFHDEAIL